MKNNINPALQELKQFIGTWEMELSNASFFATLKPRGILVSYAIFYALNIEQFYGDVLFGANRKPVGAQLLAKCEESCFLQHLDWQGNRKFRTEIREDFAKIIGLLNKGVLKPEIVLESINLEDGAPQPLKY